MEIRDIIIIIMFIQLVIVSWICIRNAEKILQLQETIKMVDDKHDLIEKELSNIINEK